MTEDLLPPPINGGRAVEGGVFGEGVLFRGVVEAIHIAPLAQGEMVAVPEALVEAGKGVRGDRYAAGAGTFSTWPRDHEFTLVEAEAIESAAAEYGISFVPGETRRNITTRGIGLNPLVGTRFQVGEAVCEGTRLCEPCAHLENVTGKGGLARILAGRGGLRAVVLETGIVRVGDTIVPCE